MVLESECKRKHHTRDIYMRYNKTEGQLQIMEEIQPAQIVAKLRLNSCMELNSAKWRHELFIGGG